MCGGGGCIGSRNDPTAEQLPPAPKAQINQKGKWNGRNTRLTILRCVAVLRDRSRIIPLSLGWVREKNIKLCHVKEGRKEGRKGTAAP